MEFAKGKNAIELVGEAEVAHTLLKVMETSEPVSYTHLTLPTTPYV